MTDASMHIGELAERTGLSLRTLRHYDELGLVTPSGRTDGGFRLYTADDEARVMLIRRMKPLGYSLEQMRELLDLMDRVDAHPHDPAVETQLESVRDEALERRDRLKAQLAAAEEFLTQLQSRSANT
ncbi:MerR family transcriptional regulator [Microbacterium sp. NPDC078428]|uniref:MerR family transcriptional regulator n=1 Tax=Microbacterium sp. NPDC078428 TaxID=3364190 RepID=UPI0037C7167A